MARVRSLHAWDRAAALQSTIAAAFSGQRIKPEDLNPIRAAEKRQQGRDTMTFDQLKALCKQKD